VAQKACHAFASTTQVGLIQALAIKMEITVPDQKEPLATATASVVLVGELIKAAGNDPTVKEAAGHLGKAALTLSKTINNALLPLAAVNFAFEKARIYFESKFQEDLSGKASAIPEEFLQEPKASVAGPALQALAFTHEEDSLRNMFLGLLATAMDSRKAESAHPAFIEIIKQLDSVEAPLLVKILKSKTTVELAVVEKKVPGGKQTLLRHLVNMHNVETGEAVRVSRFPAMVDNWARLGLVEISYSSWLTTEGAYSWVGTRPEYVEFEEAHNSQDSSVTFTKGFMRLTDLGKEFASAVGSELLDG